MLVVVSVVLFVPTAWMLGDRLFAGEPDVRWERHFLMECVSKASHSHEPWVQFAIDRGEILLVSDGRRVGPFDQFAPGNSAASRKSRIFYGICERETNAFIAAVSAVKHYRDMGMVSYNIKHRDALDFGWLYLIAVAILWLSFFSFSWVAKGFKQGTQGGRDAD